MLMVCDSLTLNGVPPSTPTLPGLTGRDPLRLWRRPALTGLLPLLSPDGGPGCKLGFPQGLPQAGEGLSQANVEAILVAWA